MQPRVESSIDKQDKALDAKSDKSLDTLERHGPKELGSEAKRKSLNDAKVEAVAGEIRRITAAYSVSCESLLSLGLLCRMGKEDLLPDRLEELVRQENDQGSRLYGELQELTRLMLDSIDSDLLWHQLDAILAKGRPPGLKAPEDSLTLCADDTSSLGDPIDWEFESIDPKGLLAMVTVVSVLHPPENLQNIVFGSIDITKLRVVRPGCSHAR
ncbi:hypothetical protein HDU91_005768 [Kappamyces sp. JEL0680]|nr:hypothetical protein HDU91_005768 [Kappamyces sp. JEL0680]